MQHFIGAIWGLRNVADLHAMQLETANAWVFALTCSTLGAMLALGFTLHSLHDARRQLNGLD